MKISLNWLKNYIDIDVDIDTIIEKLTLAGIEVEEVEYTGTDLPGVVIGKVIEKEKHPNADKLSVCKVDVGKEKPVEIVCGAPNVAAGMTVPVATVGAVLPGDFKIKKAKLRGVVSRGMICSEKELGLGEDHSGIWDMGDVQAVPGTPISEALDFERDIILDLFITPNRSDCLSAIGIARELGALLGKNIKKPVPEIFEEGPDINELTKVTVEAAEANPRYSARVIRDVTIDASPEWLQKVLLAAGMRPINNVVDVTNYVMLELGQPLHAFDFDLLAGPEIIVRYSRENEKFITLDEKEHQLPPKTVMICDAEKSVAIGGIMGGLNSEISDKTKNILLESAYFTPEAIRGNARKMGISTESSQRFEKGVDPNSVLFAQNRAAVLIAELTGGKIASGYIDVYPEPVTEKEIPIRGKKIKQILGIELDEDQVKSLLLPLGIYYENEMATAPTFRHDLEREIDLVEEVARRYGLDNIPAKEKAQVRYRTPVNEEADFIGRLKDFLTSRRLFETVTNTMVSENDIMPGTGEPVKILNPLSDDMKVMRTNVLPSLIKVYVHNRNRQQPDVQIFEVGRAFVKDPESQTGSSEWWDLTILLAGKIFPEQWGLPSKNMDIYYAKGLVEDIAWQLRAGEVTYKQSGYSWFDDIQLDIFFSGNKVGYVGRISPRISEKYDVKQDLFGIVMSVEGLRKVETKLPQYKHISKYPLVRKDVSFIISDEVKAEDIRGFIAKSGSEILRSVEMFDLYQGKHLGANEKSIAFKLIFQSDERTLKEKEVLDQFEKIITLVQNKYNARLRSR